jgi:hypothetical protein
MFGFKIYFDQSFINVINDLDILATLNQFHPF